MWPSSPRQDSWTRRVRRAAAIATAIVLVVSTVAVQTREAAVAHVRCELHGQLVHLENVAANTAGDRAPGVTHVIPARGPSTPDHEHCPLVGMTHCNYSAIAQPAVALVATAVLEHPPIASEYAVRPTFRLAPKTSPPV